MNANSSVGLELLNHFYQSRLTVERAAPIAEGGNRLKRSEDKEKRSREQGTRLTRGELFWIFLKAGFAFGGGLGILAVLEDELVDKRLAVTKEEFLTIYGIGRIVPSGTMTALAVAYGYKFGGLSGTVITLAALSLPVFVLTIALTIAYHYLRNSRVFDLLPVTIMPAALALIVVAALKLGKDVFRPSRELIFAGVAFSFALFLRLNPAFILLAGGVLGAFALRRIDVEDRAKKKGSEK